MNSENPKEQFHATFQKIILNYIARILLYNFTYHSLSYTSFLKLGAYLVRKTEVEISRKPISCYKINLCSMYTKYYLNSTYNSIFIIHIRK